MANPYKTYKMKLTTLSPIFIGGGESILNLSSEEDFKNKVLKNNPKRVEQWIDYFLNFQEYKRQRDRRIPFDANTPSLSGFLRFVDDKSFKPNHKKTDFILTVGKGYIPGTSVKGAIRTALLSEYIIKNNVELKVAEDKIKAQMKGLQISDSELISYTDSNFADYTITPQKIIDNKQKGYSNKNFQQKYKFLKAKKQISLKITIDTNICEYSIEDILDALNNHYLKIYKEYQNGLKDTNVKVSFSSDCIPNINIGGQSGFNTKNVLRALAGNNEFKYVQAKKNTLSKKFKNHNHDKCKDAPRYFKVVNISNDNNRKEYLSLGWCNLSVEKEIDVSDITN